MIQYDKTIPFVEHFNMFQIPDTMAQAVEQYRIDILRSAMAEMNVGPEIFKLLITNDDAETDNFGSLCDPVAYFGDISLSFIKPTTSASLPPLPSTLADMNFGGPARWIIPYMPEGLRLADNESVRKIAILIATSFCDADFVAGGRDFNLRYIALNSVEHPASKVLRESNSWQPFRRLLDFPDMVATRKADFVQLFVDYGSPLEPQEMECFSKQDIFASAIDMREMFLSRNRHAVFCQKCLTSVVKMGNTQALPQTVHIC